MKAFIVYCHPSDDSSTRNVRDAFVKGLSDAGHEFEISDLYKMEFKTDMSEKEYIRDANYRTSPEPESDVLAEQLKINSADAIVFIYPVFWTEAPAKLVGWFDRVWSYGFAYGQKTMKTLDRALFLATAGNPLERLEQFGLLESMKRVMIGDRFHNRAKRCDFVVFDGMSREKESRKTDWQKNLDAAYAMGLNLFAEAAEPFSLDGRTFVAVENSDSGEVSAQTVFCYHQKGDTIWAEYSGGSIVKGFLVGTIDPAHHLHFTYQHINNEGILKSGECRSVPKTENGKLRFHESWKWTGGEEGTSIIEEIN